MLLISFRFKAKVEVYVYGLASGGREINTSSWLLMRLICGTIEAYILQG